MTTGPHELKLVRTLDAPRALVWKAWTTKEIIEEWWCPKPWRAEFTAFEIHASGAFNSHMRGPEGAEHASEGSILEVVPETRIVFTDMLAAGWRPIENPFLGFTAIVTFEDEGGKTRYTARALHKTPEQAKAHDEMGFTEGWGTAAKQLEAIAKSLAGKN